jgi:hypothetical protein
MDSKGLVQYVPSEETGQNLRLTVNEFIFAGHAQIACGNTGASPSHFGLYLATTHDNNNKSNMVRTDWKRSEDLAATILLGEAQTCLIVSMVERQHGSGVTKHVEMGVEG